MGKEEIKDLFLEWQVELNATLQDQVAYDHYDPKVQTLFLKRAEAFDQTLAKSLEERLQEASGRDLRVSTIHNPKKRNPNHL